MLKSAGVLDEVKRAAEFGVNIGGDVSFSYETALGRSLSVVDGQYKGLRYLFDKKHRIPVYMGRGRLLGPNQVHVTQNDGGETFTLDARDVIVNTGSRPRPIKGIPFDGEKVINSDHAVVLEHLPKSFIIRGGGATGVEWASIYHRYGSKVTLVGRIVPQEDREVSDQLQKSFQRQKMDLAPEARPATEDYDLTANGVSVRLVDGKGKERVVEAETLLVAIGRQGNIEEIGLEETWRPDRGRVHSCRPDDADERRACLRDRRRQRAATPRPYRDAPGNHRRRAHLRAEPLPAQHPELALLHLLRAGDWQRRPDPAGGRTAGARGQGGQVPDAAERQGGHRGADRRLHQDGRRRRDRTICSGSTSSAPTPQS
jgi:hypothetical protein